MKRFLSSLIMLVAILTFVGTGWAGMITGKLTKIEDSNYIVKDKKGKEHKIHFDDTTKKTGEIKEGVRVKVNEEKGHAKSIEVVEGKKKK